MSLILPDHPALAIGSVTTPDLRKAFLDAHDLAFANPGLKGVILHRPDAERQAIPPWMEMSGMEPYNGNITGITGSHYKFLATPEYEAMAGAYEQNARFGGSWAYEVKNFQTPPPGREAEMAVLGDLFNYVRGQIQTETANLFSVHFDGEGLPVQSWADEDSLFHGRAIRYLRIWQGLETRIFESGTYDVDVLDDGFYAGQADEADARWLRTGDIFLFFDATWGRSRACAHSSPGYALAEGEKPRLLDNIDLGAGRKLADLRARFG